MATKIVPTFLLRGISPTDVAKQYHAGKFSRPIPDLAKITVTKSTIITGNYGAAGSSVYAMKDRNNASVIIATSGFKDFDVFDKSGGVLGKGGRCDYCKQDFDHEAVGYPIRKDDKILLTQTDDGRYQYRVSHVFWTDGRFHSYNCALSHLNKYVHVPSHQREIDFLESDRLLRMMYRLQYPDAGVLKPAEDYRLLICNGGSLTPEEWENGSYTYTKTERVISIPLKTEYFRSNFNDTVMSVYQTAPPVFTNPNTTGITSN